MSFPRYPAYKDSSVEWLGEVPEHWEAIRLKNALKCRITDGPHTTPEFVDEGVPFLSVDGIQEGELVFDGCRYVSEADHSEFQKKASPMRDDILMGKAASTGKIARVKTDLAFSIWSPLALIRVNDSHLAPSFCEYFLKSHSAQAQIDILCTSNTQKNISMDDIPRLAMTRPPIEEQVAIATFLDRETAKIDALIAEQQRLIELLQEKRQAVISHAVTKGLNPDAPMKDSGVEWLGEVPEHWGVRKLSQLCEGIGSGTTPKSDMPEFYEDGVIPWVVTGDLNDTVLVACSNHVTDAAVHQHSALRLYELGSVVVAMYGATIGKAAMLGLEATVNQACCVLPPGKGVISEFLLLFILAARSHLLSLATGGGQPNINQEIVRSLRLPLPPLTEQHAIVQNVEASLQSLDSVASLAATQVALLQERRSALISAAVTGQIDVRGLVAEASAA